MKLNRLALFHKLCLSICFECLLCSFLSAQSIIPVHKLGVKEGLLDSHNAYFDLDDRTYFFSSGYSGLYRYNGVKTENFSIPTNDNLITSKVYDDATGRQWFTTSTGIYTIEKDSIRRWPLKLLGEKDYVSAFHMERDSFLWLTAGNKVFSLNVFEDFSNTSPRCTGTGFVNYAWTNAEGVVHGIARPFMNETAGIEITRFYSDNSFTRDTIAREFGKAIKYFEIEKDSLFWIPTKHGLIELNPYWCTYKVHRDTELTDPLNYVDLTLYGDQYLLVASENHGLFLFDKTNESFEKNISHYHHNGDLGVFKGLSQIHLDEYDNLWIKEKEKGFLHVNLKNQKFTELFPASFLEKTKELNVNDLIPIGEDTLTAVINEKHLFLLIRKEKEQYDIREVSLPIPSNQEINGLMRDENNDWWVTAGKKLYILDSKFIKVKHIVHNKDNPILETIQISSDTFAVRTHFEILLITKSNLPEDLSEAIPVGFNGDYPEFFYYDTLSKRLFVSFNGTHLQVFDHSHEQMDSMSLITGIGILSGISRASHPDTLWFSTNAGLFKYSLRSHEVSPVTVPKVGSANTFESIMTDRHGFVWLGTLNGLIRFDPLKDSSEVFNDSDGLYVTNYGFNGATCIDDKLLLFYGKNGATKVNPDEITFNNNSPKVVLEEILVEKQKVNERPFLDADNYPKLDYDSNDLSFTFSTIEYSDPKNNSLFCLLIKTNNNDTVSTISSLNPVFPSLSSGKYELQVYPINSDDKPFPDKKTSLYFKINPPWYFSTAAIISYVLISSGVILGTFYYMDRQKTRRYEREKEILKLTLLESEQKLRLLDHHMISNIFSSITDEIEKDKVDLAKWYSKQASRFYRRYLDINEEYAIDLATEKKYIEEYIALKEKLYEHRFKGSFEIAKDLDPEDTLIPTFLTQIFVENAVKYAFPSNRLNGQLTVRISKLKDQILCEIEDNGIGRQQSAENKSGDEKHNSRGIQFTKERLAIIETQTGLPTQFEIIDLVDENGTPCGTSIRIVYPIDFDVNAQF